MYCSDTECISTSLYSTDIAFFRRLQPPEGAEQIVDAITYSDAWCRYQKRKRRSKTCAGAKIRAATKRQTTKDEIVGRMPYLSKYANSYEGTNMYSSTTI